ncbi:MAG: CsbD family protein [Acidimicrobiales bacterium]
MSEGKFDDLKGRAKETVGEATDNQALEREGKVDRASGSAKSWFGDAVDKVRNLLRRDR